MKDLVKHLKNLLSINNLSCALFALQIKNGKYLACQLKIQNGLEDFLKDSLQYLIDKDYASKTIEQYPLGKPKDHIEAIEISNDLTRDSFEKLKEAIISAETNNTNRTNYNAYIIVVNLPNGDTFYFINNRNPIKNYSNSTIFHKGTDAGGNNEEYKKVADQLLQLSFHYDCIITNSFCYFITLNAENIMQIPKYYARQTEKCIASLLGFGLINNDSEKDIRQYLKQPGKTFAMSVYDTEIINDFAQITSENLDEYNSKYNLNFEKNSSGKYLPNLSTDEEIGKFIKTITNKRAKGFNNKPVTSSTSFVPSN